MMGRMDQKQKEEIGQVFFFINQTFLTWKTFVWIFFICFVIDFSELKGDLEIDILRKQ